MKDTTADQRNMANKMNDDVGEKYAVSAPQPSYQSLIKDMNSKIQHFAMGGVGKVRKGQY